MTPEAFLPTPGRVLTVAQGRHPFLTQCGNHPYVTQSWACAPDVIQWVLEEVWMEGVKKEKPRKVRLPILRCLFQEQS